MRNNTSWYSIINYILPVNNIRDSTRFEGICRTSSAGSIKIYSGGNLGQVFKENCDPHGKISDLKDAEYS